MRRILLITLVLGAGVAFVLVASGSSNSVGKSYKVQLDNAFGLVSGADLKIDGVRAGKITSFSLDEKNHALVGVKIDQPGFGSLRTDVHCQSRPQSLIGEYFLDCAPGKNKEELKAGAIIPVAQTETTVAPDLVNNVLRMPYRERLRLIINELGAAVAGNGEALNTALHRANPALRETDRLLALLANQRNNITALTGNADSVVTALAQNKGNVVRFITEAKRTAVASAQRRGDIQATFHKFPALLEQLKPTMAELGRTADAQRPALANLSASSPQLKRFFNDLVPFSNASTPAFRSLGQASIIGRQAASAARPTVGLLNSFARRTPEVSKNLAIILRDLDNPNRAVERDSRADAQTGRKNTGYTGLEALLQYTFNQPVAINSFDGNGQHLLRVNAFTDNVCSPYTDTKALAADFKTKPAQTKRCLSFLGPNQPGFAGKGIPSIPGKVNPTSDPSFGASTASASSAKKPSSARSAKAAGKSKSASSAPAGSGSGLGGILGNTVPGIHLPSSSGKPAGPSSNADPTGLLNYLLAP
ncbi:MAG: MlaD family protein [Solirubrobacteraceae bacterium]